MLCGCALPLVFMDAAEHMSYPVLSDPVMFSVQGAPDDHRREHSADECPRRGVTEDAR